jgi:hypothetical protein
LVLVCSGWFWCVLVGSGGGVSQRISIAFFSSAAVGSPQRRVFWLVLVGSGWFWCVLVGSGGGVSQRISIAFFSSAAVGSPQRRVSWLVLGGFWLVLVCSGWFWRRGQPTHFHCIFQLGSRWLTPTPRVLVGSGGFWLVLVCSGWFWRRGQPTHFHCIFQLGSRFSLHSGIALGPSGLKYVIINSAWGHHGSNMLLLIAFGAIRAQICYY